MIAACLAIAALTALLAYREWVHAKEREAAIAERATLLNRIQAPDVAIAESVEPEFEGLSHVPIDDDRAFQEERERIENA